MTTFAQRITRRGEGLVVLGPGTSRLRGQDLANAGLSGDLGPHLRVALCLRSTQDLLRALAALDGRVAQLLLLSPALPPRTVAVLAETAGCSVVVSDRNDLAQDLPIMPPAAVFGDAQPDRQGRTIWLMTTSGTTGLPKIVPHTLHSLSRSVVALPAERCPVWGLLYDPTRFAGLQVVLQALFGGGDLVVVDTTGPLAAQVADLVEHGCTHLSATPTLWRRILMLPGHRHLTLRQVTLGGEIADATTLRQLRTAFPDARLTHIYASTEAGVGFSVTDGLPGFPLSYLDRPPGNVGIRVADGMLWLRPPAPARPGNNTEAEGYVRTGDLVEIQGDRVVFLGRENGIINVAGVKVHPEAVEAILTAIPGVALARVSARRSAMTGALVVAEITLADGVDQPAALRLVQDTCRLHLPREAVPAIIRFVDGFDSNAAGKLSRVSGEAP